MSQRTKKKKRYIIVMQPPPFEKRKVSGALAAYPATLTRICRASIVIVVTVCCT